MKKKKLQCSVPTLLLAGVLCLTLAACGAKQSSDMLASDTDSAASAALPVKARAHAGQPGQQIEEYIEHMRQIAESFDYEELLSRK